VLLGWENKRLNLHSRKTSPNKDRNQRNLSLRLVLASTQIARVPRLTAQNTHGVFASRRNFLSDVRGIVPVPAPALLLEVEENNLTQGFWNHTRPFVWCSIDETFLNTNSSRTEEEMSEVPHRTSKRAAGDEIQSLGGMTFGLAHKRGYGPRKKGLDKFHPPSLVSTASSSQA
jgi:hypothetical protein